MLLALAGAPHRGARESTRIHSQPEGSQAAGRKLRKHHLRLAGDTACQQTTELVLKSRVPILNMRLEARLTSIERCSEGAIY